MNIFYEPGIKNTLKLSEEESRHAIKVLRLTAGDLLYVVDGKGGYFKTQVSNAHEKRCELRILEEFPEFGKRDFYIHIAIAPTKNLDRIEWMVEKCVEIGVDEISFLQSRYSERKEIKIARIEKIAIGAMKQSLKAFLPKLNEMVRFEQFLKSDNFSGVQKFIAHLEESERKLLHHEIKTKEKYCILIGPEGDFSKEEISQAIASGFNPVSLGESRLRTETAGIVACHTLNLVNQ